MENRMKGTKRFTDSRKIRGFYSYEEGRKVSVSKTEYKIPSVIKRALKNCKY